MTEPDNPPHIIRRAPTGPIPAPTQDARTSMIRRAPTGEIPTSADDARTKYIDASTSLIPQPAMPHPNAATSIAAAAVSILNGWATAVIATNLITGWWNTDRLFCLAVGFLAAVFGGATVVGVILLLLQRSIGRWLIIAGAVVALLTFAGIFVAGAKVAPVVYAIPALPIASVVLTLLPATRRWSTRAER